MAIDLTEPNHDEPRKRVGVVVVPDADAVPGQRAVGGPREAGCAQLDPGQERMLTALEDAFPVRFDSHPTDLSACDGVLVLGRASPSSTRTFLPRLVLPSSSNIRERPPEGGGWLEYLGRSWRGRSGGALRRLRPRPAVAWTSDP